MQSFLWQKEPGNKVDACQEYVRLWWLQRSRAFVFDVFWFSSFIPSLNYFSNIFPGLRNFQLQVGLKVAYYSFIRVQEVYTINVQI